MKHTLLAATAIGLGFAALAPAANATLIEASINGGAFTTICSAASGSACANTTTLGGISFVITGMTTNSPGTSHLADILSASVMIADTNPTATGTTSVVLRAGDTGFTAPTAPPTLRLASEIGGSVLMMTVDATRKPPAQPTATDAEAVSLYRTMIAYAGTYRVQGNEIIYHVEISSEQTLTGTDQTRFFKLDGDRLTTTTPPHEAGLSNNQTTVTTIVWERVK